MPPKYGKAFSKAMVSSLSFRRTPGKERERKNSTASQTPSAITAEATSTPGSPDLAPKRIESPVPFEPGYNATDDDQLKRVSVAESAELLAGEVGPHSDAGAGSDKRTLTAGHTPAANTVDLSDRGDVSVNPTPAMSDAAIELPREVERVKDDKMEAVEEDDGASAAAGTGSAKPLDGELALEAVGAQDPDYDLQTPVDAPNPFATLHRPAPAPVADIPQEPVVEASEASAVTKKLPSQVNTPVLSGQVEIEDSSAGGEARHTKEEPATSANIITTINPEQLAEYPFPQETGPVLAPSSVNASEGVAEPAAPIDTTNQEDIQRQDTSPKTPQHVHSDTIHPTEAREGHTHAATTDFSVSHEDFSDSSTPVEPLHQYSNPKGYYVLPSKVPVIPPPDALPVRARTPLKDASTNTPHVHRQDSHVHVVDDINPAHGNHDHFTLPAADPVSYYPHHQVPADNVNTGLMSEIERTYPTDRYQDTSAQSVRSERIESESMDISEWNFHTLPSGKVYFSHPKLHVVTDVDIRSSSNLRKISNHISRTQASVAAHQFSSKHPASRFKLTRGGSPSSSLTPIISPHQPINGVGRLVDDRLVDDSVPGDNTNAWEFEARRLKKEAPFTFGEASSQEMWIRSLTVMEVEEFAPLTLWVDHAERKVLPRSQSKFAKGRTYRDEENDQDEDLDAVIAYWKFMESHSAHAPLPAKYIEEATEVLNWSYSDLLLHPHTTKKTKGPFTLTECHELLELLRSIPAEVGGADTLKTHITSKILLRYAQYRKQLLLANSDGSSERTHIDQNGALTSLFGRFFATLFCFGVPFLFAEPTSRKGAATVAEESSVESARAPPSGQLVADSPAFAASLTLMATLLITASVGFLSLPGVEDASRLASMLSLVFASSSLGASVINLRRRAFSPEHMPLLEARHRRLAKESHPIIRALPLLFSIWAIIGLVTATFLYVFLGEIGPDGQVLNEVLRWVLVGVGAAMTVLLILMLGLSRR